VGKSKTFEEWFLEALKRVEMNQSSIQARLDLSSATVSDWRHGNVVPRYYHITELARILHVNPREIYEALGLIPPLEETLPRETLESIELMRYASPEERQRAVRVLRELLDPDSSGTTSKEGTAGNEEEADE
jgi:transcriptional regulator with XRE-family HTH domain